MWVVWTTLNGFNRAMTMLVQTDLSFQYHRQSRLFFQWALQTSYKCFQDKRFLPCLWLVGCVHRKKRWIGNKEQRRFFDLQRCRNWRRTSSLWESLCNTSWLLCGITAENSKWTIGRDVSEPGCNVIYSRNMIVDWFKSISVLHPLFLRDTDD